MVYLIEYIIVGGDGGPLGPFPCLSVREWFTDELSFLMAWAMQKGSRRLLLARAQSLYRWAAVAVTVSTPHPPTPLNLTLLLL